MNLTAFFVTLALIIPAELPDKTFIATLVLCTRFRPDIVHAHDAWRTGMQLLGLQTPWVVSVSGDDIFTDIKDAVYGPHVCEVLRRAHRVLVPSAPIARLVEEMVPDMVGQVDVVPRASLPLPTGGTDLRRSLGIPRNRLLLLLPGGLRPIKGQARALPVVDILRRHGVDAELVLVGPEQDPEYAAELRAMAAHEPRIRILPSLSRERMGATYMNADVVLNTSEEEAMSLSILEAGLLGGKLLKPAQLAEMKKTVETKNTANAAKTPSRRGWIVLNENRRKGIGCCVTIIRIPFHIGRKKSRGVA